MRAGAPALALAVACLAAGRDARAQMAAGLDLDGAAHDTRDRGFAYGADVRVGFRFGWPRGWFLERAFLGQAIFQIEGIGGAREVPDHGSFGRLAVGARVGYSGVRLVEPFVFFHGGVALDGEHQALGAWDLGGALDCRFSTWSVGVHATIDRVAEEGAWLEVGPHVEFRWLLF